MSLLKEEIERDLAGVFLSEDDFGETHSIEGKSIVCVLSADQTLPLPGGYRLGITDSQVELFAKQSNLGFRKKPGNHLMVNGVDLQIDSWDDDMGLAHIRLSKAEPR